MTKTTDNFDTYAKVIDKFAKLVSSYLEDDYYYKLIKIARLKPITKIRANTKLKLINHWVDEFGNSLIIDGKEVKYLFGDVNLLENSKIKTDTCFNLKLEEIYKLSKSLYCGVGENHYELSFLGRDNYLRSYLIWNGEIQNVSSLLFSRKIIEAILNVEDNKIILTESILKVNIDHYITKLPSPFDLVTKMMQNIKEIENK